MWMPVTNTTKPNESLGNHVIISTGCPVPLPNATTSSGNGDAAYKEKYGSMKVKLKDILYENELFQDELKTLKRELLDIYRDKDTLLQTIVQFEKCLGSSDESDVENPTDRLDQRKVLAIESAECKAQDAGPVDQETLKRKVELDVANNKKICINLESTEPKSEFVKVPSNSKPKTAASRNRKSTPTSAKATNANPDDDPKIVSTDSSVSNKPPAKKTASNNKSTKSEGIEFQKPTPVKRERKKPQPKEPKDPKQAKEPKQPKQPKQPKKPTVKQQAQKQEQTTITPQTVTVVHQLGQQQVHLVPPENRLQDQSQKFKMEPQQPQQQPITVQLGPMSLPTEQIKYIQHVNLPVQNLDSNSMIVTSNTNQIQIQQQQQQNHLFAQQPQQIHFQLPQTTLPPVIDAFQNPQSMITTQGNQITFNGQSYTIVSTTSDGTSTLLQHDQIQSQQQQQLNHDSSSPEHQQHRQQMMTQIVPMNTISPQEVNSISPQSIQNYSPEQEQHHQQQSVHQTPHLQHQQQSHDNQPYQPVQFRANQTNQIQINQNQLHEENVCAEVDFEHHLDTRRMEDAALLDDWQAGYLFDNYLGDKFMVED